MEEWKREKIAGSVRRKSGRRRGGQRCFEKMANGRDEEREGRERGEAGTTARR